MVEHEYRLIGWVAKHLRDTQRLFPYTPHHNTHWNRSEINQPMLYTDDELAIIAEIETECLREHPVYRNIRYVVFVSNSKGRNRLRRRPVEVHLIGYQGRYRTEPKFPYDTAASEIYGRASLDNDNRLRAEIPLYARRG